MVASGAGTRLEELAHDVFDVVTRFCLEAPRSRRRSGDLKDIEFLTLSLLYHREPLIVGDLQRQLGVLPAQMSRIIRSLETRDCPLISCRINLHDKRKIDVVLTAAGRVAFQEHQAARVRVVAAMLEKLSEEDREGLRQLVQKISATLESSPTEG